MVVIELPPAGAVAEASSPRSPSSPGSPSKKWWQRTQRVVAKPSNVTLAAFWAKVETSRAEVRSAQQLSWNSKGLTADDCKAIAHLIASGSLAKVESLRLSWNELGDEVFKALSAAIASAPLVSLHTLGLYDVKIGDAGMAAFSAAIGSGCMPSLTALYLGTNEIGDAGMQAFSSASTAAASLEIFPLQLVACSL